MTSTTTAFIIDDDPAELTSLSTILRNQGISTECFRSADEFLKQVDHSRRGCLLLDVRKPEMSGLRTLKLLLEQGVHWPVIMMTNCADVKTAAAGMQRGSIEFLPKPFPPARLAEILAALQLADREQRAVEARDAAQRKIHSLTDEERKVLNGIARGLTNQQIADELDLSLRTVQFRRSALFKSLGVSTRAELFALIHSARLPAL